MQHSSTVIWRHRKENLKKCSLRGLECREDFRFFTYPTDVLPCLGGYVFLTLDAPPLSSDDRHRGLFIIDATWRYARRMARLIPFPEKMVFRSVPSRFVTAYPRRQEDCSDVGRGLASVEAIFLAYRVLGRNTEGLLDHYYWRKAFLKKNNKYIFC